MSEDGKDLFYGSAYTNPKTWDALVELARAIVALSDRDQGEGCNYASAHVSDWGHADDPKRPGHQIEMHHVSLTFSLPASKSRAALCRAKVLDDDSPLAKDQEIRASLIEME